MRPPLPLSALLAIGAWAVLSEPGSAEPSAGMGDAIAGAGVSTEPWIPYLTEDPFVWAADACLGFFMTRLPDAFGAGEVTGRDRHGIEVVLGAMEGRIRVHRTDDDEAFRCSSMRWPELAPSAERLEGVALWIGDRLRSRDGWLGWFDAENPEGLRTRTIAEYRNEPLGVTLRVEARHEYPRRRDYLSVSVETDDLGPPMALN